MKKSKTMTKDELNHLVSSIGMEELTALTDDELWHVEGGRARLPDAVDDGSRSLPVGDDRVDIPAY